MNKLPPATDEQLYVLLSLVIENEVPLSVIRSWTMEQRKQVETWAARTYVKASDNLYVRVPRKPDFLSEYK